MANRADTADHTLVRFGAPRGTQLLRSVLARLSEWRRRSEQRATLASMNDRMLKDVGISRGDAVREASKPFWQA
jgi:uncharacterized protein YjiS (DUF1127 family)